MRHKNLLIEFDDAKDLQEGQKLTLKNWGNSLVTKIEKENEKVTGVWIKLTPEDLVFKNTKVVHWVPLGEKMVRFIINIYSSLKLLCTNMVTSSV